MKIVYGITKSNFGGAQRYVFDLARGAKEHGHEVVVMCGEGGTLVDKLRAENIRVIEIPGFGRDIDMLRDAPRLWFIFKNIWKERPDVLHINSAKMGGAGIFTGRLLGVKKIIFTGHGWAFNEPRPMWQKWLIKFFTWLTIVSAHKTICVSNKTRQDVSWPFTKNKLVTIYNGLDAFPLEAKIENIFTVGTLAELHKIKGLDILLQAWKQFTQTHSGKLVIYGAGGEEANLKLEAKSLKLEASVEFKGFVPNAKRYLGTFDVFVLPSRSEAMPYAVLEAGIAGTPVVASHVGGIPEIIESDQDGLLVEPKNVQALSQALIELKDNPELANKLGRNLKQKVESKFSLTEMVEKTLALY